jgi:hypothetical protein
MKKALLFIISMSVLNAFAAYWLVPTPSAPALSSETNAEFSLPELAPAIDTGALYKKLRQHQAWGAESEQQQAAETQSTYSGRFAGVVHEGGTAYVLILDQGKLARFTTGDELPDNGRVISVTTDAVEIERQGERETLRLYHTP